MKKYKTFVRDGVLVDTEFWYYPSGEHALADIGLTLDKDQYLRDKNHGLVPWAQARAAGVDDQTTSRLRAVRNNYHQEYLRTEAIEIVGVVETLAELSRSSTRIAKSDGSWIFSFVRETTREPNRTRSLTSPV